MINPGIYNVQCWQGADWDRTFTISQSGVPLNLTGYSAAMQVRESADADTYLLSLTNGTGITLGGTAGTITVAITSAQSSAIAAGSYSYDLEIVSNGGAVTRLLQGSFNVVGNVTR
jgi:hypothetical protein